MKRNEQLDDLFDIIKTRQGRAVICRYLERMSYFSSLFDADPVTLARNVVMRDCACDIAEEIEREFPDQWISLLTERQGRIAEMKGAGKRRQTDEEGDENG